MAVFGAGARAVDMIGPRSDLSPAVAIAIQQRAASTAIARRDGMDDGGKTRWRRGSRADGGLHLSLQLGSFLLDQAQGFFGIAPGLMALVGIEDQQRGQHPDADSHTDLPGEAFNAMRSRRQRWAAIGARTKLHILHVLVEPGLLTFHGIPRLVVPIDGYHLAQQNLPPTPQQQSRAPLRTSPSDQQSRKPLLRLELSLSSS